MKRRIKPACKLLFAWTILLGVSLAAMVVAYFEKKNFTEFQKPRVENETIKTRSEPRSIPYHPKRTKPVLVVEMRHV